MDPQAVLAAFDEQIRRGTGRPGDAERDEHVVRRRPADGWAGVTWSGLTEAGADAVIAAEIDRFAGLGREWEWKHYSYDEPADLPDRLRAAGFTADPAEALLVAEVADLDLDVPSPPGVRIVPVTDEDGVAALVSVHDQVFGGDHSGIGRALLRSPDTVIGLVAWAGELPVSAARIEWSPGVEFAGLWGGGTLAAWRGRGLFRALVSHRAALAAARGYRYLQVDASDDSRPILRRLAFTELATTTPFMHPGGPGDA